MPLTRSKKLIKSEPHLLSTDNIPSLTLPKKRAYLLTKYRPIIKSEPTNTVPNPTKPDFNYDTQHNSFKQFEFQTSSMSNLNETSQLSQELIADTFSCLETNSDQFYRQHALAYLYERSANALLRFRYLSLDALLSVNGETPKVLQQHLSQQTIPSPKLPSSAHSSCDCIHCALQVIHRRFCPICNPNFSDSPSIQTQEHTCNCLFSSNQTPGNLATHYSHSLSSAFHSLAIPESLLQWSNELKKSRFLHFDSILGSAPVTNGTPINHHVDSPPNSSNDSNFSVDHLEPLRVLPSRACKQLQPPPQISPTARRRLPHYSFRVTRKRIKRELYMPFANDMRRFLRDELDLVPEVVASLIARRPSSRRFLLRPIHSAPAIHTPQAPLPCEKLAHFPIRKSGVATQWLSRQRQRHQRRARSRLSAPDWSSVQYLSVRSQNATSSNRRERAKRHAMRTGTRARGNCRVSSARSSVN